MKVLAIAGNDSDNLMISNILFELERRGHELKIYSLHQDNKTLRMFQGLNAPICRVNQLSKKEINWADCIFKAHPLLGLPFIGEHVMCDKYMYIYATYIEDHWATSGGDFMFTCGTSRHPIHAEDCASMPIGCPKNDHLSMTEQVCDGKTFLFIDSGHYPFSHKGKMQVADMLLEICAAYPDYKLVVKPRFLPNDINTIHTNRDHLYTLLEEQSGGILPENLILLQEHRDMQELIDECSCAIMLCTSAYIDVALRNKSMLIVKGIDNEDKFDLRNDIEYKNIYDLREKSGCVVDYREVVNYLPDGLHCREEHTKDVVAYRTNASGRAVDVMEYIHANFLSKGLFPAIKQYCYENYQEEMGVDHSLSWNVIKQKRIKNMGNVRTNSFNRVIAKIDYKPFLDMIDNDYINYETNLEGINSFLADLDVLLWEIWIQNKEKLMLDILDQAQLLRALYNTKKYMDLCDIPEEKILCKGAWHYYLGMIFYQEKNYEKSLEHFQQYIKESAKRKFEKYECEDKQQMSGCYYRIANMYDGENITPDEFAELFEELCVKEIVNRVPYRERNKLYQSAVSVSKQLYEQGNYEIAARCSLRCVELSNIFNEDRKRVGTLRQENSRILHSISYRMGRSVTWLPRKIRKGIRFLYQNGVSYAGNYIVEQTKEHITRTLFYRMTDAFRKNIWYGYKQYTMLQERFGENSYIYLSAGGTGDVYISNLFYNSYINSKKQQSTAVCVCPGESCYQTTTMFDIERAAKIDRDNWILLLHLFRYAGNSTVRMEILYYHIFTVYTGYVTWLESYKGWNLYRLMKEICFPTLTRSDIEEPKFNYDSQKIIKIFEEKGLKQGKTVILSPYAKWPPQILGGFWEKLASALSEKGYSVCTNSVGESEPPIENTVPVFFSYDLAVPFIETAGYIIGLRSGLLDIIESAVAKKVALYPYNCAKRGIADGTAMGSFSLNEMFGKDDWLELETTLSNLNEVIDNILEYFNV